VTPKARKQNAKHERETPLAVIYTRVSTEDQAVNGPGQRLARGRGLH
jgi:hypothetical protein